MKDINLIYLLQYLKTQVKDVTLLVSVLQSIKKTGRTLNFSLLHTQDLNVLFEHGNHSFRFRHFRINDNGRGPSPWAIKLSQLTLDPRLTFQLYTRKYLHSFYFCPFRPCCQWVNLSLGKLICLKSYPFCGHANSRNHLQVQMGKKTWGKINLNTLNIFVLL